MVKKYLETSSIKNNKQTFSQNSDPNFGQCQPQTLQFSYGNFAGCKSRRKSDEVTRKLYKMMDK